MIHPTFCKCGYFKRPDLGTVDKYHPNNISIEPSVIMGAIGDFQIILSRLVGFKWNIDMKTIQIEVSVVEACTKSFPPFDHTSSLYCFNVRVTGYQDHSVEHFIFLPSEFSFVMKKYGVENPHLDSMMEIYPGSSDMWYHIYMFCLGL